MHIFVLKSGIRYFSPESGGNGTPRTPVNYAYASRPVPSWDERGTDLAEVVEVVLAVNPAERRSFVEAVRLVDDVTDIAAHAVVHHPFEQLIYTQANQISDLRFTFSTVAL